MFKNFFVLKIIICIILFVLIFYWIFICFATSSNTLIYWDKIHLESQQQLQNSYIKWVDFSPTYNVLKDTSKLDIDSHNNSNENEIVFNWIELLAYLACKYGGNFNNYKYSDLSTIVAKLKSGNTMEDLAKDLKYYSYYFKAYDAVLHEFIGEFEIEVIDSKTGFKSIIKKYGIKAFSPIAKNYNFNHYDDFGSSRSYGYKSQHLGNDLM